MHLKTNAEKKRLHAALTRSSKTLRLVPFFLHHSARALSTYFFINVAATPPIKLIGSYKSKQIFGLFGKDQKINLNSEIKLVSPNIEQIQDWTLLVNATNVRFESISSGDL